MLLAECFGSKALILVKDVDGVYDEDPKKNSNAKLITEISSSELKKKNLTTLPFDRVMLDLMENTRLLKRFQVVNGRKPGMLEAALNGEAVGSLIYAS